MVSTTGEGDPDDGRSRPPRLGRVGVEGWDPLSWSTSFVRKGSGIRGSFDTRLDEISSPFPLMGPLEGPRCRDSYFPDPVSSTFRGEGCWGLYSPRVSEGL